tara:strand:+ start:223 stop:396 length:174 start_codon:yes stop_codon:yes gene_type:complete
MHVQQVFQFQHVQTTLFQSEAVEQDLIAITQKVLQEALHLLVQKIHPVVEAQQFFKL